MEGYRNIIIFLLVSLAKSHGVEEESTTTIPTENDTQASVNTDSQLDRLFFGQEVPDEFKSTIPSVMKELDGMTDEQFLKFLEKAAERAKQSYEELKSIHDQLEKNLSTIPPSQRLKRCHACHKKRMGFISPMPVFVPVAIPMHYPKFRGGCGGYGGCGGGGGGYYHGGGGYGYQQPQVCHSCGGGGYGGGGGGSMAYASASASASSGSWGKK
ncbi:keratin, type II cytoskeletal 59 kDa, component IV-like isoform X2 [Nilaparvata lugens]|uniref:keratin, type II cytoskeletal 59 kDa, component IV-like isoform X2 n=1 Tax=Nilaparvata lugens TaxID=108931 RepID=UPI00193E53DB|nr:keratin, type II cytoskeletal 59 kDa, component IV-like isoform X2 [Nilaparvata lugens]